MRDQFMDGKPTQRGVRASDRGLKVKNIEFRLVSSWNSLDRLCGLTAIEIYGKNSEFKNLFSD